MKILSIILIVLVELLFCISTLQQKNKGAFYAGLIIIVILLIPLSYIINN